MGDQIMPRYFFHLRFGQRVVPDEEGVELPNQTAARDEALAAVRELTNPKISQRRWASWFIDVADESGGFFRTPIGHPALEVVTPDRHAPDAEKPNLRPAQPGTALPEYAAPNTRTAEIVRQMAERRDQMAQLLKKNHQLRQDLSSLRLATEELRDRTNRLVALAREGGVGGTDIDAFRQDFSAGRRVPH
jgi:hypothetical protein